MACDAFDCVCLTPRSWGDGTDLRAANGDGATPGRQPGPAKALVVQI